mgnify:CR=1 FL=1|jgi:predicted MPP superfamily phosphohydrolase
MALLTRRRFLQGAGAAAFGAFGLGSYAMAVEPGFMLDVTSYRITPHDWPEGLVLRAVVLADIHACEPWMPAARVRRIAEISNALQPDLVFLLGDFNAGHRAMTQMVAPAHWGAALSVLRAPLGSYAILGNHDWWHGALPGMPSEDAEPVRRALRNAGVRVLENDVVRLDKQGKPFWVAGLADQIAHWKARGAYHGLDDLPGTLAKVGDDAPVLLLAHEPYIYKSIPERVALSFFGHTHGGQVNLPIAGPTFAARRFGADMVYGLCGDARRPAIISAGLGTSILPMRFMRPPEIVHVTIGGPARVA